eukprot:11114403-Heterocapsa_arctica.AAC.1
MNTITRLEDDLQDHRLDLASRAASPERNLRLERNPPTTNEVMDMINLAFTSRERGRSPARFDLAADDGTE